MENEFVQTNYNGGLIMVKRKFEEQADRLCNAIRHMANDDNALENFNSYLSYHFDIWLNQRINNDIDNFVEEIYSFAHMYDDDGWC